MPGNTTPHSPALPVALLHYIGQILTDDYHFKTLANLNVSSKDIYACTLKTLWKTVYLRINGRLDALIAGKVWKNLIKSAGRLHIQFLDFTCLPRGSIDILASMLDSPIRILERIESGKHFPNLHAITFDRFCPGTRLSQPFHDTDVFLQPKYDVNTIDDLHLWAILNVRGGQLHVTIFPPYGFHSHQDDPDLCAIIPFLPAKSAYIRRMYIDCRNIDDDDTDALSAGFQICLAMASYSRGYWSSMVATGHKAKGKVQKANEKTCLDISVHSGIGGVEECMAIFADALSENSRFVETRLEFKYEIDWENSEYDPEDVLPAVTDAAEAFRPLQTVYAKACRDVGPKRRGMVEIEQQMEAMFKLSLVHDLPRGKKKPELVIWADLGPYEDSEDEDYYYSDPAPKFILAKLEDL